MSLYDWLLFLHVLTAFALVAALVVYWTIGVLARNVERPADSVRFFRVARPANVLVIVGTLGTVVFGIALALEVDAYELWDGWILGAIVLWAIAAETGRRGGLVFGEAQKLAERLDAEGRGEEPSAELQALVKDRGALVLNLVSSLLALVILADMVWKPGA